MLFRPAAKYDKIDIRVYKAVVNKGNDEISIVAEVTAGWLLGMILVMGVMDGLVYAQPKHKRIHNIFFLQTQT